MDNLIASTRLGSPGSVLAVHARKASRSGMSLKGPSRWLSTRLGSITTDYQILDQYRRRAYNQAKPLRAILGGGCHHVFFTRRSRSRSRCTYRTPGFFSSLFLKLIIYFWSRHAAKECTQQRGNDTKPRQELNPRPKSPTWCELATAQCVPWAKMATVTAIFTLSTYFMKQTHTRNSCNTTLTKRPTSRLRPMPNPTKSHDPRNLWKFIQRATKHMSLIWKYTAGFLRLDTILGEIVDC